MKSLFCSLTLFLVTAVFADDKALLKDDFSNADLKERRAIRGDWKYEHGVATCTQDDELYKKFKDHGPILFYDLPHTNALVKFQFKPDGAKSVVFTANGEKGHVFRFILNSTGMNVRAFPPEDPSKSIAIAQENAPLVSGEWVKVEVKLDGNKAIVKLGDTPSRSYEHSSFSKPKVNLSIGFSYGTLSVKDFVVY